MATNLSSCVSQEPFIKLGTGSAPSLNYSLPQKASFSSYGDVVLRVDPDKFNEKARYAPQEKINYLKSLAPPALQLEIKQDIERGAEISALIQNVAIIDRNSVLQTEKAATGTETEALAVNEVVALPLEVDQVQRLGNETIKRTLATDIGTDVQYIAEAILEDKAPLMVEGFGGFKRKLKFVKRPPEANPMLFVVEEYKTSSFLGDYGAGKTLETFSLLPGERTTITVRTYKELKSVKSKAENIVDSFSQASATEMENLIQEDNSFSETEAAEQQSSETASKSTTASVSLTASAKFGGIAKVSATASLNQNTNQSNSTTAGSSEARSSNVNALSKALEKHIDNSNSNRTVNINSSTEDSSTETSEAATTREIVNPNKSRVLNFVFRQLLQEYVTITYLNDIKIVFCNGHPESFRVVPIQQLTQLLNEVLNQGDVNEVREMILHNYNQVENYRNDMIDFLEAKTYSNHLGEEITYMKKRANLEDTYQASVTSDSLDIKVPGVILKVDQNILRTPSVVVDSLLGQGEALDCFNQKVQDAEGERLVVENQRLALAVSTLQEITDPVQRAELYAKMFNPPVQNAIS